MRAVMYVIQGNKSNLILFNPADGHSFIVGKDKKFSILKFILKFIFVVRFSSKLWILTRLER